MVYDMVFTGFGIRNLFVILNNLNKFTTGLFVVPVIQNLSDICYIKQTCKIQILLLASFLYINGLKFLIKGDTSWSHIEVLAYTSWSLFYYFGFVFSSKS